MYPEKDISPADVALLGESNPLSFNLIRKTATPNVATVGKQHRASASFSTLFFRRAVRRDMSMSEKRKLSDQEFLLPA